MDCRSLNHVTLPPNLLLDEQDPWHSENIFANCTNLTHIVLPALKAIPHGFFQNCSSLSSIELPAGLERIGQDAFSGTALASVVFPDTLRDIEAYAFRNTPLHTIALPAGLEYIGPDAFAGTQLGYRPIAPNLRVIHSFLFAGSGITEYTIPASVELIDEGAFKDCKELITCDFSLATNLIRIGAEAFNKCSSLKGVDLSLCTSLTTIDREAFARCSALESITFPDSLISIGIGLLRSYNFSDQSPLIQAIHLPAGITEIPDEAFYGCILLEQFSSDSPITRVGHAAFSSCVKLKSFSLDQVNYIGDSAFDDCRELAGLDLSPDLTYIGGHAFHNCHKITTAHLSNNLKEIKRYTFTNCKSLQYLTLPDKLAIIRYAAFWGIAVEELELPDSLSFMEDLAFAANPHLKRIVIPETFSSISESWFRFCTSIQSIQFPATVSIIGEYAFYDTLQLEKTFYAGAAPTLSSQAFGSSPNVTHYVFAEHYQSFIDAGYSNVVIVNRPFDQENPIDDQPKSLAMSFNISPEWHIVIECTPSLAEPNWQPIAIEPQIDLTENRETYLLPTENASHCFYRAVAYPLFLKPSIALE